MLFNSYVFFVFFAGFMALYWSLRRHVVAQNVLILVGSWVFYGWWDERFLILILVSIVTDYVCGWGASGQRATMRQVAETFAFFAVSALIVLAIAGPDSWWIGGWLIVFAGGLGIAMGAFERLGEAARRKGYLWLSIVVNLGVLGVFKYFDFFAEQLQQAVDVFGVELGSLTLDLILPVGISFYTFQTMSYTIDCYRREIKASHRLLELAAYVSFFPQLVAGPIERAHRLLPQFFVPRTLSTEQATSAIWLFVWGLTKKIVIADNLAPVADMVFAEPGSYGSAALLAGVLAFTFQIYCDFSGYSDMARGTARLLGFELMLNFNLPYIARTPSEFWQRWHISLSSWLRDYLYIPLGGNRLGPWRVYRNLSLTMLLGGLWHGASWTFVVWGAYHGLILIIYRVLDVDRKLARPAGSPTAGAMRDVGAVAIMFVLTVIGWLFFRATSLGDVGLFLTGVLSFTPGGAELWAEILPLIGGLLLVQAIQIRRDQLEIFAGINGIAGLTLKSLVAYSLIFLAARGNQQFIYFDF